MKIEDKFLDVIRKEGLYEEYNDMFIPDRLGTEDADIFLKNLKRLGLGDLINENSILVFGKGGRDIKVNESFGVLFSHQDLTDAIKVEATLKYVNLSTSRKIDFLPKGSSGVCLIEFKDSIPDLIWQLRIYGEKDCSQGNVTLYLSEKPIIDRLKELSNVCQNDSGNIQE